MEPIYVLLVDDEENFRRTVAKRLTKRGMHIRQAGSGEECLNILLENSVDVVVLDLKMPGMDGMEALHRIKEKYPRQEVIMLTGHATTRDGVDGIKSGAFDYLSKPIELEHLASKIRQAHEKHMREMEIEKEKDFRAKMEQQMIATERLASLGTLAAGVAHEINNPLAIIKESAGWMKSILQKEKPDCMSRKQDFETALEKIENGVERARRITHQLLGSVKQTEATVSRVDLKELVKETMDLHHKEAAAKGIELNCAIKPPAGVMWTDPYKLRQIIINILSNAVHATESGGRIDIKIDETEDRVVIIISDTGRGIPGEHLEKIFEPFFSTKPTGEGTGLGLFVTRSIMDKLGGEIAVESRVGQGTVFRLKLPKHPDIKSGSDEGRRLRQRH